MDSQPEGSRRAKSAGEHIGIPARRLSTAYIAMLAVAMVVGAGVFRSPAAVASAAGSAEWTYVAWALGGVISLIGALCYAELASAFPDAGGDYHFLKSAYGRRLAFMFAWARLAVINTGQIALLAFVLGAYMNDLAPIGSAGEATYAAATIVALTLYNLRPRGGGNRSEFALAGIEVAGVGLVIAAGVWLAWRGGEGPGAEEVQPFAGLTAPGAEIGNAMVFAMLAYGGWSEISTLSAEARGGARSMVRALIISVALITVLYLGVNWALLSGLGYDRLAQSEAPAAELMAQAFGPASAVLTTTAIALAVTTSINATILTGGRTLYAWARDWPDLAIFAQWSGRRGGPASAIILQSVTALALVALGAWLGDGFAAMVDFTSPVFWVFMTLSGLAVVILRRRAPDVRREFRAPFHPILPVIFSVSSALMAASATIYAAGILSSGGSSLTDTLTHIRPGAAIGLFVLSAGALVLLVLLRRSASTVGGPARSGPHS